MPEKMNRQEVFNKAFLGMASQGFRLSMRGPQCAYRSRTGNLRCAIGHTIPDDAYDPKMDSGYPVFALRKYFPEIAALYADDVSGPFLTELQGCHDSQSAGSAISSSRNGVRYELELFAERHGLTVPEIPAST